ncbi:hypothetical protein [Sphingobacterium sp. UBA5670]|nr:hypothetical protein [Sphingobacterium sp. UBA5670]
MPFSSHFFHPLTFLPDLFSTSCIFVLSTSDNVMAKQVSLIKLEGNVGDLSFFKSKTIGFQARMKTGVSGDRIATDPAFARTRENGSEFGRAQQYGKLLRDLLRDVLFQNSDSKFSQRLASRFLKVIQSDTKSARGERVLTPQNLVMLQHLECNDRTKLGDISLVPISLDYDRVSGDGILESMGLIPHLNIAKLQGATHVRYTIVLQEFNGDDSDQRPVINRSSYISLRENTPMDLQLVANLQADSDRSVLLLAGMEYFQLVNGAYYPLSNGQYNALTIKRVYVP